VASLAVELVETGLATPNRYDHLTLNPALCTYLCARLDPAEREALTARWVEAMRGYAGFLEQQQHQDTEMAATLTVLGLPNLFALLDLVERSGDAEATIGLATALYSLLHKLGKPRLLERVGQVRDAAAEALGDASNHARFEVAWTRIEQQLAGGRLREALDGAQQLIERAGAAGERAYPGADYHVAMATYLLGQVLFAAGAAAQAMPLFDDARGQFEAITTGRNSKQAEGMASICIASQGDCLLALGRLDEAATAYEESIRRAEHLDDGRQVAVSKGQLGNQRRHEEALAAYADARQRFTELDEPGSVAVSWHQTGIVYQMAGQPEPAEDAYRKSLAINVRLGKGTNQASTLNQLANLYAHVLDRPEEAVAFHRQAADKYVEIDDAANEGRVRNNLGASLRKLRRFDEARQEVQRAIECKAPFGHAAEPWTTWSILADIETAAGNPTAAAEAKGKATACYLAYRRDGGENHFDDGRLARAVTQPLLAGNAGTAATLLQQDAPAFKAAGFGSFTHALQAIVVGSRDRTLAEAPELHYTMVAEILFLIETLEAR
jgi:tetratricopeptide (TPR) repeat protein